MNCVDATIKKLRVMKKVHNQMRLDEGLCDLLHIEKIIVILNDLCITKSTN